MRIRAAVAATALLILLIGGCSGSDPNLTDPNVPGGANQAVSVVETVCDGQPTVINGYAVEFLGRTYANDQTTFGYRVYGVTAETAATHFTVEIPDCAGDPDGYSPTGGVSINNNPQAGVYGIEWHTSITPDGTPAEFSVSFPGDVPLGVVRAIVKRSEPYEIGEVPGPCAGYLISGNVFVDADSNSVFGPEAGIGNVTVRLTDAEGCVSTTTTDAFGAYSFVRSAGDYTVAVPLSTPETDFNEELASAFTPTTALAQSVTVGPDAIGVDFGFIANTRQVINDIENGYLTTDGEGLRFWKRELLAATKNGGGNAVYTRDEMLAFIAAIQALALQDPFQFPPGQELEAAGAILSDPGLKKDPMKALAAALLVTEFNHVSGRGLESLELQLALIAYGESVIADASSAFRTSGDAERLSSPSGDVDMYAALNNDNPIVYGSTGGGGGDE